ncbi:MAG: isochorismatase family cysteine hydrolase [Geminicoccaceae bacterium]
MGAEVQPSPAARQRVLRAAVLCGVILPLPHGPLPAGTAHLCIDMQRLFAEPTPWQTPWMAHTRPVAERLARHRPESNVFTRFIPPHRPEDAGGAWLRYFDRWRELTGEIVEPHLLELVPELKVLAPAGLVVDKSVYSAFHDGRLAPHLQRQGIDTLVVSGTETDVCVLASVLAAVDHGFRVVVAVDALCSSADATHDALVQVYRDRFGQQIEPATVDTILAQWDA